jgi:PKHD-type hydroxylase
MSWKYDYFWHENVLSKKEIKDLHNYIDKNFFCYEPKEDMGATPDGVLKKITTTKIISLGSIKDKIKKATDLVQATNSVEFGYNIFPINDGMKCLLNMYDSKSKGHYDYHIDSTKDDVCSTKLTVLINLSKGKYEGGKFFIFNNGTEYEVKQLSVPGNMVLIKSHLNHKVTPVTKGIRSSLSFFINGPKFI